MLGIIMCYTEISMLYCYNSAEFHTNGFYCFSWILIIIHPLRAFVHVVWYDACPQHKFNTFSL